MVWKHYNHLYIFIYTNLTEDTKKHIISIGIYYLTPKNYYEEKDFQYQCEKNFRKRLNKILLSKL